MYIRLFKRIMDIGVSLIALIVLMPLLLIMTLLGAVEMKGNPFFVQKRPGKIDEKTGQEKIFLLIKFRSMTNEKDKQGNFLPDELRLNKYGKIIRATSCDELPELLNILKGDMSLVGPRPQLVRDMVFMTHEQRKRHTVRPGLTGLAQVRGRNSITWETKLSADLEYVENITFLRDLKIIGKTIVKVLRQEGISEKGMDTSEDLGDYLLRIGAVSKAEYENRWKEAKKLLGE